MAHFLRSCCMLLLPLFCLVVIINNCSCTNLTESHRVNCSQVECIKTCPEDSHHMPPLRNSKEEEEDDYEEEEYDEFDYDYNEYNRPLELDFEENDSENSTQVNLISSIPLSEATECCPHYECVCNKCNEIPPVCPEGKVAVLIQKGQGVPGNCCSIYECQKRNSCTEVNPNKQTYWINKCIECRCLGRMQFCDNFCPEKPISRGCYSDYLKQPIANGDSWMEGQCMTCTCKKGKKSCIIPVCSKLSCKEYITKNHTCCPICKDDPIHPSSYKSVEESANAVFNVSDAKNILLSTNKIETAISIKPFFTENTSISTNINKAKPEDGFLKKNVSRTENESNISLNALESTASTSNLIQQVITPDPNTLEQSTIISNTQTSDIKIPDTLDAVITNKVNLTNTILDVNAINIPTNESFTTNTFKNSTAILKTSTIKDINFTTQLSEFSTEAPHTKYTMSTESATTTLSVRHFNTNLYTKQNERRSILLNHQNIAIIIAIPSFIVLSVSLAFIIRFMKSRKKTYLCIPNSDTSLSQTSTNPILKV